MRSIFFILFLCFLFLFFYLFVMMSLIIIIIFCVFLRLPLCCCHFSYFNDDDGHTRTKFYFSLCVYLRLNHTTCLHKCVDINLRYWHCAQLSIICGPRWCNTKYIKFGCVTMNLFRFSRWFNEYLRLTNRVFLFFWRNAYFFFTFIYLESNANTQWVWW